MNPSRQSPNLDFLRSAAVTFVVCFHLLLLFEERDPGAIARLGLPHSTTILVLLHSIGLWGVLIFFVHTSLVLMFSLERQWHERPGRPIFFPFLARRIFRIYPLSVFVVLLVSIGRLPVAHLVNGRFALIHLHIAGIIANLFLVQNLSHTDSVIAPLWSLPYEMEMYLFLPLLFLFARSRRTVWPIFLLWLALAIVARLEGNLVLYVPCFLAGVVAYKLSSMRCLNLPAFLLPPTLAVITVLFLERPSHSASWACCLLLGVSLPQFREVRNVMVRKVCQVIARYSYGIYLLHFICIWIAFQAIQNAPDWVRWLILGVTICGSSWLSYHLIEEPMIRARQGICARVRARLQPTLVGIFASRRPCDGEM